MLSITESQETTPLSSRWEKEARYYHALLQQDLFGWVVVKRWGAIGKPSGRQHVVPCSDYANALLEYQRVCKHRLKSGYSPIITSH